MNPRWSNISLFFLFLVALLGTLLRSNTFVKIPWSYTHLVHAHSHTAFQGWIYLIIFLLLTNSFLTNTQLEKKHYPIQFKLTALVIVGILISFSIQGYGLISITFSTLFQLFSYWFIFCFIIDIKMIYANRPFPISIKFITTGLCLGLLSSIFPYAIGAASAKGLNGTDIYNSLIYAFLHLQYNGWFLFIALGLFFHLLDYENIYYNKTRGILFYWLIFIAIIPSISLSLLGMEYAYKIENIAYVSSFILGLALIVFILTLPKKILILFHTKSFWYNLYLAGFILSFSLKIMLQCFSILSLFESYAFQNKLIIIAYLHLSLIGSISFLFFALMINKKWIVNNVFSNVGNTLLFLGFASTEIILIMGGVGIFYSQALLILGSGAMAVGILAIITSGIIKKHPVE